MRRLLRLFLVSSFFVLAACEGDVVGPGDTDSGVINACQAKEMGIEPIPRCASDDDCCAREECRANTGLCIPLDECAMDSDCPMDNQRCVDEDDDGYLDCIFERCETDAECEVELADVCSPQEIPTCSAGGCICGAPCDGGCAEGQGCCIPEDRCDDLPPECEGLSCPPGQIVSVTNPGAWDTGMCDFLGETCECIDLPPLYEGDIGLYSAMAFDGTTQVLSGYNITYGDLMYGVVQQDRSIQWEYIDGVPSSTTSITGAIDGPRAGNSDEGPDVGIYTDIAVDADDKAHIVYHNRDNSSLEYAVRGTSGWTRHTIATEPVAGLYSSLTLSPAGTPIIAYLAHQEAQLANPDRRQSVLRAAFASSNNPSQASDWTVVDIATTDLSAFGCDENCRVGEVCRAADGVCFTPTTDCPNRCTGSNECNSGTCVGTRDLNAFREIPTARGLWPSAATQPDGTLLIAYYDSIDTSLNIARLAGPDPSTGAQTITTLDGQAEDAGLFPSLYITPAGGEIHLAYMNQTQRSLEYVNLDNALSPVISERIATGIGAGVVPGGSRVGADPALVVDANGVVRVAFQDATLGHLRYASRTGANAWTITTMRGDEATDEGVFGFYNDQVLDAQRSNPVVSTYRFFLSALPDPDNGMEILPAP